MSDRNLDEQDVEELLRMQTLEPVQELRPSREMRVRELAANMCGTLRLNPGNHLVMTECLAEATRIIDALDATPVPARGK